MKNRSKYFVPRKQFMHCLDGVVTMLNTLAEEHNAPSVFVTSSGMKYISKNSLNNVVGYNCLKKLSQVQRITVQNIFYAACSLFGTTNNNAPLFFEEGIPVILSFSEDTKDINCSFDIVKEHDLSTFKSMLEVFSDPSAENLPAASVIHLNKPLNGKPATYLSERKESLVYPKHWQNPGGKIEYSEDPLIAATRELKEETGLDMHYSRFLYSGTERISDPNHPLKEYLVHVFTVELLGDEEPRNTEPDKASDWVLTPLNELQNISLMVPALRQYTLSINS